MEKSKNRTLDVKGMVLCALFAALIAVGAFLRIPISYVPVTLQFLFTNLAGLLLGRKKGFISVALYIFIGLVGIPIFTQGGGPGYIFQPTFGYILGFALGTWLAGLISEKGGNSVIIYILAGLANFVVMFAIGLAYFYLIENFYLSQAMNITKVIALGFLPFAAGDAIFVVVCAFIAKRLQPLVNAPKARA